jgi:hypothetical protein
MAASVQQRIAFGERAGQQVRRIGAGFGYEGASPALTGPAVPGSRGFRCTLIPRFRRIDVTSWSA